MLSTHQDKVFSSVNAANFSKMAIGVCFVQIITELNLIGVSGKQGYLYYYYLDWVVIGIQLFSCVLIWRYVSQDTKVRRSCLPIGILILMVMSSMMVFQSLFLLLKNNAAVPHEFMSLAT